MQIPTHEDVASAARRLHGHVVRTPMLRNPLLDELTGGTILIKAETLQRTGSFKLRGAANAALQLDAAQRRAGVVTHSSGNHGQALACAASQGRRRGDDLHAGGCAAGESGEHAPLGRRNPPLRPRPRRPRGAWPATMPRGPAPR